MFWVFVHRFDRNLEFVLRVLFNSSPCFSRGSLSADTKVKLLGYKISLKVIFFFDIFNSVLSCPFGSNGISHLGLCIVLQFYRFHAFSQGIS